VNTDNHSHALSVYWLVWFLVSIGSFMAVEFWALARGRGQDTLSAQIWRLEQFLPGQNLWQWTALHVLIGGGLFVLLGWLIGHFVFGVWR
jgi:hypothetical protein